VLTTQEIEKLSAISKGLELSVFLLYFKSCEQCSDWEME